MEFVLDEAVLVLRRTPRVLDAWLRGLPDRWLHATEGGATWSPTVVVGHLIHGEHTDWIPRARIILEHGESHPFVPFDRFAQTRLMKDRTLDSLLDELVAARDANLETLAGFHLTPADLARTGRHPELGTVTLGQLLATWVAHDLDHLAQVARVMARRYGDDVGPWTAYLSVLKR
jgi:DinB superfamily